MTTPSTTTTNGSRKSETPTLAAKNFSDIPVHSLRNAMNKLFDDFTIGMNFPAMFERGAGHFMPRLDVSENEKAIVISAELPGMEVKDIEAKIMGDNLFIRGEKKEEKEESTIGYHRVERAYGSFERVMPLPPNVKRDTVEAVYKDGVLKVTLPKTEEAVTSSRKIEVKAQ